MKPRHFTLLLLASMPAAVFAAPISRSNTADSLNLTGAWVGGTAPGTGDTATWDASSTLSNTLGTSLSWGGLDISAASGGVTIGGANTLTIGSSGLNTGGTAGLTYNSTGTITLNGPLAGSTTLTLSNNVSKNWSGMTSTSFTGTLVLRGGSAASGTFTNNWVAFGAATFTQTGSFGLDTGESLTNRGEFIVTDAWGDGTTKPKMALSSLTGFGDFRSDWGATGNRTISLNSTANHEFQGRIVQNNTGTRSVHLEKLGSGTLTLSGENAYQNTIVGGGKLQIGNGGATGNIGSGTVSVASGTTLEFNRTGLLDYKTSARMRNVSGAGDIILNGGVKLFNYTGSGTGFAEANSWLNFSGTLTIKGGSEFQTIRNGATAMGTAQVVLGDATTSGKLSQIEGNWTWTNNIQLVGSANEILNNGTTTDRYNKLQGVISGSGGVTFKDTTGAMSNGDRGFILTGTNTMNGTLTVDTFVRVGGVPGNDITFTGGASGTLGSAAVVINTGKRLTFTRTDSHVVANAISGGGDLHIGTAGLTETATQVVDLSGTGTYTGATSVNRGRLKLTGSLTSAVTVASAAKISGGGSTTGLLTLSNGSGLVLAGGATTTSLTAAAGVDITGPAIVTFDTDPVASTVYDVFTYGTGSVSGIGNLSVAWRGALSDDTVNKKYIFTAGAAGTRTWNTTDGDWEQGIDANFAEGDNLFYGGDTVFFNNPAADSTITLWGALVPQALTVNNTNGYTFTGSGSLTGSMTLTKTGTGALTLANTNTYTGGTVLQQGQLNINSATAIGTTTSVLTIAGVSSLDNTSGSAITISTNNPQAWNADFSFIGSNNLNLGTGAVTLGADRTVTVNAGELTVGGAIAGTYGITKAGAGSLSLSGALSYSGATLVNQGSLRVIGGSNILVPGISVASGAVFEWAPTVNNVTFAGTLTGTGKVLRTDSAANNAVFTGDNSTFNGSWEITGDYLGFASDASIGVPGLGMTWNGGGIYFTASGNTLAATRTITLGAAGGFLNGSTGNTNTFAAKFTGSGNLNKVSGERAILTNPDNDFTGAISITGGGTLEIGGTGRLGSGLYSNTISIGAANALDVNSSAAQSLAGVISGGGRLIKAGAGILTLDAVNTYTGSTTIDGGTLTLGVSNCLADTSNAVIGAGTVNLPANVNDAVGTLDVTNAASTINLGSGATLAFANSGAVDWTGGTLNITGTFVSGSSLRFGTDNTGLTVGQLAQIAATGWTGFALDANGFLTATPSIGSPEIAVEQPAATDIANGGSQGFGTVTLGSNTSLTFTIRNTGTDVLNLTGTPLVAVSGANAADFTVTATPTTPVTSGGGTTTFTVQFAPGGAGARSAVLTIANNDSDEGTFTINVSGNGQTQYDAWSGGAAFNDDANGDGVKNGMAFLLGAASPTSSVTLPVVTQSGGNLTLTFNCRNAASRGSASLSVEHSSNLGISDPWAAVAVPETSGGPTSGVTFTITPGSPTNGVIATISSSEAASGKLFGRLKANQ